MIIINSPQHYFIITVPSEILHWSVSFKCCKILTFYVLMGLGQFCPLLDFRKPVQKIPSCPVQAHTYSSLVFSLIYWLLKYGNRNCEWDLSINVCYCEIWDELGNSLIVNSGWFSIYILYKAGTCFIVYFRILDKAQQDRKWGILLIRTD